jgi:molecular chaperone GrpE (heat shock protein)
MCKDYLDNESINISKEIIKLEEEIKDLNEQLKRANQEYDDLINSVYIK